MALVIKETTKQLGFFGGVDNLETTGHGSLQLLVILTQMLSADAVKVHIF